MSQSLTRTFTFVTLFPSLISHPCNEPNVALPTYLPCYHAAAVTPDDWRPPSAYFFIVLLHADLFCAPASNKFTILCDPAGNRTRDLWLKDERANE